MKKSKKKDELNQEAIKAGLEVAELLAKSSKMAKAMEPKKEEPKEDEEPKESSEPKEEPKEGIESSEEPKEDLAKNENEDMSADSSIVDLKSLSPEQILDLASRAMEELELRGVLPERNQEDAESAEHELNEIKEDLGSPVAQEDMNPEMEKVANMAPPAVPAVDPAASEMLPEPADAMPTSLDDVLGKKDLSQLENLCAAINSHIAARKEMEKTANGVVPEAVPNVIPNSMMKSMVSEIVKEVKASLLESLRKETSDLKKSVSAVESLVKSHRATMSTPSNVVVPATTEASKDNVLVKSNTESIVQEAPAMSDEDSLLVQKELVVGKIMDLQKSHKGGYIPFYDLLKGAKRASSVEELATIINSIDSKAKP